MKELHYCSRCEKKFIAHIVAEVLCPRCRATSGVSRILGAYRLRRLHQLRIGIAVLLAGFTLALYVLRAERAEITRHSLLALMTDEEIDRKAAADIRLLRIYADGLDRAVSLAERSPELFKTTRLAELDAVERRRLETIWSSILDYLVALDAVKRFYADFWRVHVLTRRPQHTRTYLLAYGAWLIQYAHALRFVDLTAGDAALECLLDQAVPDLGVPAKTFAGLKWSSMHLADASRIYAGHAYAQLLTDRQGGAAPPEDEEFRWLLGQEPALHARICAFFKFKAPESLVRNALDRVKDETFDKWFPVPKEVSGWMGDTRTVSCKRQMIDDLQVQEMVALLRPGDILVARRNWFLDDVGLPGFWPHAMLYVGSPEEWDEFFRDPEVESWIRTQTPDAGGLRRHLERVHAGNARRHAEPSPRDGKANRVIESAGDGVGLNSVEEACGADFVGALRPRLSKLAKAKAILRAFAFLDAPYDYRFDFLTDTSLSCSELVYKSYGTEPGRPGLGLELVEVLGNRTLPANEFVRAFDAGYGTEGQGFDFVYFLDGQAKEGRAVVGDVASFRASCRRPKWDILQQ